MNKRTFLAFALLTLNSFVFADEYITNEYYEEVVFHGDQNESMIIYDETEIVGEIIEAEMNEDNSTISHSFKDYFIEDVVVEKEETKELSPYLIALKEAQETGKVILLAIRATNCHYCDKMERETLNEASVKSALEEDFIVLHYNQDLEPLPLEIQEGMTPNFFFVDQHENIINQHPGMKNPKEFKEALAEILSK